MSCTEEVLLISPEFIGIEMSIEDNAIKIDKVFFTNIKGLKLLFTSAIFSNP